MLECIAVMEDFSIQKVWSLSRCPRLDMHNRGPKKINITRVALSRHGSILLSLAQSPQLISEPQQGKVANLGGHPPQMFMAV